MKKLLILLAGLFLSTGAFAQLMGYCTDLRTTDKGMAYAELTLVHRSRVNYKDITEIGKAAVMFSTTIDQKLLKIEGYRFKVEASSPFEMDGKTFISLNLIYDCETQDHLDDLFVISIPIEVDRNLIESEMKYYEGLELLNMNFQVAASGDPTNDKNIPVQVVKEKN